MKCNNCEQEFEGKFCPNCGTPAPEQTKQAESPVYNQTIDNSYQTSYGQQFTNQPSQDYNGQQFTNQPNQDYNGQQFTNQPANGVAPNGKKPMSTGKLLGIVFGVVGGVLVLLAILFIIVFIGSLNKLKENGTIEQAISDFSSELDKYESEDFYDYFNSEPSSSELNDKKLDSSTGFYYSKTDDGIVIKGCEFNYDYTTSAVKEDININIPEKIKGINVVEIEAMYFYVPDNYKSYVTITIPGTVNKIDDYAFAYSRYINEVVMEDGVKEIGFKAFFANDNLKKVYVPGSVTQMDNCGLGFCNNSEYDEVAIKDFVMIGKKDSVAEKYCNEKSILFKEK